MPHYRQARRMRHAPVAVPCLSLKVTCVEINQCVGCFSTMTRLSSLASSGEEPARHAIEQASRRDMEDERAVKFDFRAMQPIWGRLWPTQNSSARAAAAPKQSDQFTLA